MTLFPQEYVSAAAAYKGKLLSVLHSQRSPWASRTPAVTQGSVYNSATHHYGFLNTIPQTLILSTHI